MIDRQQLSTELDKYADQIISRIYWFFGQLPPVDWREEDWPGIRERLLEDPDHVEVVLERLKKQQH